MNILTLSTIPHYLSSIPVRKNYTYRNIICISSTLSIAYHIYDNKIITFLDYFMAFVWGVYDVKLGLHYKLLKPILFLNLLIFIININISSNLHHSIWHLLSASKCYYISNLVNNTERKTIYKHAIAESQ